MSFYTVIKYVPNPETDESINVGVLAFAGLEVCALVTSDFMRARTFGRSNPSVLRATLADIRQQLQAETLNESTIRRMCDSWRNKVQLTAPRASTQPVQDLLNEVAAQFLPKSEMKAPVQRVGKRRAVKIAVDSLTEKLKARFHTSQATARKIIKLDYEAPGHFEQHEFDLALVNGELKLAAKALSFALENKAQLKRDIDATAFVLEDMRKSNPELALVVLGYRSDAAAAEVERAEALFGNWNVPVVTENRIAGWSRGVVQSLPADVIH